MYFVYDLSMYFYNGLFWFDFRRTSFFSLIISRLHGAEHKRKRTLVILFATNIYSIQSIHFSCLDKTIKIFGFIERIIQRMFCYFYFYLFHFMYFLFVPFNFNIQSTYELRWLSFYTKQGIKHSFNECIRNYFTKKIFVFKTHDFSVIIMLDFIIFCTTFKYAEYITSIFKFIEINKNFKKTVTNWFFWKRSLSFFNYYLTIYYENKIVFVFKLRIN